MRTQQTAAAMSARQMEQPGPQAGGRTIEAITGEILEAKRTGGEAILTIGRCLIEAKAQLPHGEWLPWLNDQVELSERTAQKFMKLAREWSNPNTLADLGASKALMLLALPEGERDSFAEEQNVIDMSARQLEQAIRDREEALAREKAAEEARAKMEADMKVANELIAAARQERDEAAAREEALKRELDDLKSRPVDVAVETVVDQAALERAKAEAIADMKSKLEAAAAGRRQAEEKQAEAEAALAEAQHRLEDHEQAQRAAILSADKDVAQFEVLYTQAQEQANKLRGLLLKVRGRDASTGDKLAKAILALADAIRGCAE